MIKIPPTHAERQAARSLSSTTTVSNERRDSLTQTVTVRLHAIFSASGFPCASLRLLSVPVGIGFLSVLAARPTRHVQPPHGRVASLTWLTGCWVEDLGPIKVVDEWTAPRGHAMLGVSRTV